MIADPSFYQRHSEYAPRLHALADLGAHWWDFLVLLLTLIIIPYIIRELWVRFARSECRHELTIMSCNVASASQPAPTIAF